MRSQRNTADMYFLGIVQESGLWNRERIKRTDYDQYQESVTTWVAVVVYVGLPVKLQCDPLGPVGDGVVWSTQGSSNTAETAVILSTRLLRGGDSAIYILNAEMTDQGIYRCKQDDIVLSNYKLEVKPSTKAIHVIRPAGVAGDGDNESYGNTHKDGRLQMYTAWSEWGTCSECDKKTGKGERAKLGYCYAMSRIEKYPTGLPCLSTEIPSRERRLYQGRMDEKMIEICPSYCAKDTSLAANMTILGRLLGKGRLQEQSIQGYEDAHILFECPGIEIDSSVTWHNATRLIDARMIASSRGRISIDIYDGLHINKLNRKDGNPYHCYIDGKRKATFRLIVTGTLVKTSELIESFIYIGALIIIYWMVFIIIMLCKHNIRRRQRAKI